VYVRQDEPHPLSIAHRYGYLQSLLVAEPFRKDGLGKQLVVAAHQWAKEQHATEMRVETWEFAEGSLYFYEALGYRTLKRDLVINLD
jgi:GNAT superfamily N-acetyltransferase